ncbi:hypothetical protein [Celeribacter sp.]|uniref:hypothetical protein n=1 Tax=Celeribacter sp. TaxID=1890673 RepID=UPI003A9300C8
MPLLAVTDFDDLPIEPVARWLQLRDLLEKRLDSEMDFAVEQNQSCPPSLKQEYYSIVRATAPDTVNGMLPDISRADLENDFDFFRAEVAAAASKILFEKPKDSSRETRLPLSMPVVERLKEECDNLRRIVDESDLDNDKKTVLFGLLESFLREIESGSLDYKKTTSILGAIAIGVAAATSFLADAPEALTTIHQIIGLQQQAEDEKNKLLSAPSEPAIPELPAPNKKQLPSPESFGTTET